jgi:hypothetical protein
MSDETWADRVLMTDCLGCPWCGTKPELHRSLSYQVQHSLGCSNDRCFFQPSASDWDLESLVVEWNKRCAQE